MCVCVCVGGGGGGCMCECDPGNLIIMWDFVKGVVSSNCPGFHDALCKA